MVEEHHIIGDMRNFPFALRWEVSLAEQLRASNLSVAAFCTKLQDELVKVTGDITLYVVNVTEGSIFAQCLTHNIAQVTKSFAEHKLAIQLPGTTEEVPCKLSLTMNGTQITFDNHELLLNYATRLESPQIRLGLPAALGTNKLENQQTASTSKQTGSGIVYGRKETVAQLELVHSPDFTYETNVLDDDGTQLDATCLCWNDVTGRPALSLFVSELETQVVSSSVPPCTVIPHSHAQYWKSIQGFLNSNSPALSQTCKKM